MESKDKIAKKPADRFSKPMTALNFNWTKVLKDTNPEINNENGNEENSEEETAINDKFNE